MRFHHRLAGSTVVLGVLLLLPGHLRAEDLPFLVKHLPRKVHVTFTVSPRGSERSAFRQILVLPVPRSDEKRSIENLQIRMPAGMASTVQTFPETGDLYLPVVTQGSLKENVVIEYDATLYSVHYNLPAGAALKPYDTSSALYRQNTGAFGRVEPGHARIREIANRIRVQSTDVVDYARRIYEYEQSTLKWKNTGRYGTISDIFANGGGDCGALTDVFVSLMRTRGIPARAHVGGVIRDDDSWDWHVWPEFYLEGYGWVEVDPAFYTSKPGYFAYDDSMRIHFHRSGRGTVDYDGFHFETGGIQRLAYYRTTEGATATPDSTSSAEPLQYDVKVRVETIERPVDDGGLNTPAVIETQTRQLLEGIAARRRAAGLETKTDSELNAALTEILQSEINEIKSRDITTRGPGVDCRSGCPDSTVQPRGGREPGDSLSRHGLKYSGYYWQKANRGFHSLDPVPYLTGDLDEKLLLSSRWDVIGAGYVFDPARRQFRFAVLYAVK